MRNILLSCERGMSALARAALYLASLGLVLMTVIVFAQVVTRYLLGTSLFWAEPSAVLIMGWFIFLGAAVGIREGSHLSFDVALHYASHRMKVIFHSISDLAICAFGLGMAVYGTQLAMKAADNSIPGLGLSRAFDFAPLIGGGVILVIFTLERLLRRAVGLKTLRFGDLVEE